MTLTVCEVEPKTPGLKLRDKEELSETEIVAFVTPKTGVPKINCPPNRVMKTSINLVTVFLSLPTLTPLMFRAFLQNAWKCKLGAMRLLLLYHEIIFGEAIGGFWWRNGLFLLLVGRGKCR